MVATIEDFIEKTQSVKSQAQLRELFLSAIGHEGYENAVLARTQSRRVVSIPWSEFPRGYLDTYRAEKWDSIDPVVQRAKSARGPFQWSDTSARGGLSREHRTFFERCRELGVHSGITVPIHSLGHEVNLISLSMRGKGIIPCHRTAHVYTLSVQYWLRYSELADRLEKRYAPLTVQELECLRWCKEGKTNWEIGEILHISQKTVEFHLGNAMRKLGVENRISAVVVGIKEGLIPL